MDVFGKLFKGIPSQDLNVADSASLPGSSSTGSGVSTVAAKTQDKKLESLDSKIFSSDTAGRDDEAIQKRIQKRQNWFYSQDGVQPPVTEAEAEETSRQVEAAKQEMAAAEAEIEFIQRTIEASITDYAISGIEASIVLDTTKKAALRRAIRKLFGKTKNKITLEDYKALLQARTELEQEAALDYARGFPDVGGEA